MAKGRFGLIGGSVALAVLLASTAPASAFSFFGLNLGSSHAVTTGSAASNSQQLQSGISTQAQQFLNGMIGDASENTCFQWQNHEYEVCTAYIFNSVFADLVPYYKYANSTDASAARFVNYRLGSRYVGQANQLIRDRVASWPMGNYDVDVPSIKILSVNSDLAANSATLRTRETWRVADENHNVIYQEEGMYHTITMARVPSYVLHKWVVTDIE